MSYRYHLYFDEVLIMESNHISGLKAYADSCLGLFFFAKITCGNTQVSSKWYDKPKWNNTHLRLSKSQA